MKTVTLYPVEGRLIRHPQTGAEILEPIEVPEEDPFFIRCLRSGDLSAEAPKTKKSYKAVESDKHEGDK